MRRHLMKTTPHWFTRFAAAGFSVGLCLFSAACASFHGPAPLTLGSPSDSPTGSLAVPATQPTISMNGARTDTHESQAVAFDWPVDEARLTRGFLSAPARRKRPHWGVDLANHKGTPILSAEKGVVIYTGHAFHGYGKLVVIEHGDEWATLYSHLDQILVKEGQTVGKGEKIALMGRTGRATGVHLHFEIRHFRQPVNPLAYLPQVSDHPSYAGMPHANSIRLTSQGSQGNSQSEE